MNLYRNIDCFNKADVLYALLRPQNKFCFKDLAWAAIRLRRRRRRKRNGGHGRKKRG